MSDFKHKTRIDRILTIYFRTKKNSIFGHVPRLKCLLRIVDLNIKLMY